ncbi:MAG: coniferyl aldehyde dehydrogenase [Burkholderiaceae bacterium]|nr:coniferyl aldehyde dehydrogenase [Burkholderiaceae bacterium]
MNPNDVPARLQAIFEAQREAYDRDDFPTWEVRRDRLRRLRRLLEDNEPALEVAIAADFGCRPRLETQIAEFFPALAEIKGALRHGKQWMKPRRVWVSKWFLPARAEILPRPVGVVGIIVPWNYPVYLSIGPMVGALVAGNRVMVKLSEYTPVFGELFQRLVAQAFRPDEVSVVLGGPDVAAAFSALPFDHLLFTGSTAIGRKVMAAAAENLTPVTLELGGKSPTVVAPGYSIERAATRILAGKLLNAGQTCIAPDYVLLPRDSVDDFVVAARAQSRRMFPSGLASGEYTSVINARQYERLLGYLDEAAALGVRIEPLFDGAQRDDPAHRLAPALLIEPPPAAAVMRDEIFGPLLPLVGYDRVDDAIGFINARPRPLALYWFDDDRERTERALRRTHAGGVCVNETLVHVAQEELPFGGIGPSGMGHYHGRWGFETFSKLKPVVWQAKVNAMSLFLPPYRPLAHKTLKLMKRS